MSLFQSDSDRIVSQLRHLHLNTIHSTCPRDEHLVDSLRDEYDDKVARVHQLERSMAQLEEELAIETRLINIECSDDEIQIDRLLSEYPVAMQGFYKMVASNTQQSCRDRFEVKKQAFINENKMKFNELQSKYEKGSNNIIDRYRNKHN